MNCKHEWKYIGLAYTEDIETKIEWCNKCGSLKYQRTAWDYRKWYERPKIKQDKSS